jgi:Tfp pilus assembly protein PilF
MKRERIRTLIFPFLICTAILSLISCGPKTRVAVSQLDTPGHHTFTGLKLLDQEKYPDAQREFKMAIQLNNNYSKAYTGLSLVNIFTGKLDAAAENLTLASKYATSDEEKLFANVSRIRYYGISKSDPKWLEMAKSQFNEAVKIDPKCSPAYYYMGMAYKDSLEFDPAGQMFATVIQLKIDHIADATNQLNFLQKVQKAKPETQAGKKIALVEQITRADAAALFIEELKIKGIYNKLTPKAPENPVKDVQSVATDTKDAGKVPVDIKDAEKASANVKDAEKTPVDMKPAEKVPAEVPAPVKLTAKDISDHPLKTDIEGILETGLRGLETDPKGNFNPGEIISRGEYAIMLEDILIKLTGEKDLAARYVNSKSLFPDVPADMPYFNAIISVTSKGIMEAKDAKTKEFAPLKPLSGVEALLIIRKLKDEFKMN